MTPRNFRDLAVGTLGTDPAPLDSARLGVSLTLYDEAAIQQIEDGQDQVSAGYQLKLISDQGRVGSESYEYRVTGPVGINHLALVPQGRAGPGVRVLDQKGRNMATDGTDGGGAADGGKAPETKALDAAAIKKIVQSTVKDAMGDVGETIKTAVADGHEGRQGGRFKVVIGKSVLELDADTSKLDKKLAALAGNEPDKDGAAQVTTQARDRARLIDQCRDLLPDDFDPHDHDDKAILVKAVGDSVEKPEDRTVDYLRGVVSSLVTGRDAAEAGRRRINDNAGAGKATAISTAPKSISGLRAMRAAGRK